MKVEVLGGGEDPITMDIPRKRVCRILIKIQEGLLTNAKVYIHVTIRIKVVTQTAMYSQYYIHDLQRNK